MPPALLFDLHAAVRAAARRADRLARELARVGPWLAAAERRNWEENERLPDIRDWAITQSQCEAWEEAERLRAERDRLEAGLAAARADLAHAERALAERLANALYAGGQPR